MSDILRRMPKLPADPQRMPVEVRLRRVNCHHAEPCPPEGQEREWWDRLKEALGTASNEFVEVALHQLIAAARLPLGKQVRVPSASHRERFYLVEPPAF